MLLIAVNPEARGRPPLCTSSLLRLFRIVLCTYLFFFFFLRPSAATGMLLHSFILSVMLLTAVKDPAVGSYGRRN